MSVIQSYRLGNPAPLVLLDDVPLKGGLSQLTMLPLSIIDYVEINNTGIGYGMFGGGPGGMIKIYTDPNVRFLDTEYDGISFQSYKLPLTFSDDKQFYMPTYKSYKSDFYNHYGVIDWLPINSLNQNNELVIKFKSFDVKSINLYIEGITDDGSYISEIKTISLE